MNESKKYIIALVLLIGLIFNFAHSELGFMTPEGDSAHHAHDYCQLMDGATAKNHDTVNVNLLKNIQPAFVIFFIIACVSLNTLFRQFVNISPGRTGITDIPLFVKNRTLLI